MALVEVRDVTKTFRKGEHEITPLKDVSIDVEKGDFVSLMGASGSGKSTLLNLIAGIDRPTAGTVVVNGQDITQLSRTKLAYWRAANAGYVFQTHNLIPVLTAWENVEMPLLIAGQSQAEAGEQAARVIARVGLSHRLDHRPGALSGGEQQRIAVARALVARPALLLADEPTGNLDEATASDLHALLRDMHREHALTSVIVTHNLRLAALCDRAVKLEGGRISPVHLSAI